MADACLTLYESTFDLRWLREARRLAEAMVELFADPGGDGFYQTGRDAEQLVIRPGSCSTTPSRPGRRWPPTCSAPGPPHRRPGLEQAGLAALRPVLGMLGRAPTGFGHASGRPTSPWPGSGRSRSWAVRAPTTPRPCWPRCGGPAQPGAGRGRPDDAAAQGEVPLLADRPAREGRATAYVCEHFVCQQPVTEPEELAAQLAWWPGRRFGRALAR